MMKWIALAIVAVMLCSGLLVIFANEGRKAIEKEEDRLLALKTPEQLKKENFERQIANELEYLKTKTTSLLQSGLKAPEGATFVLRSSHVNGYVAYIEGNVTSVNAFNARLTKYAKATWTRTDLAKPFKLSAYSFESETFRKEDELAAAFAASEAVNNGDNQH